MHLVYGKIKVMVLLSFLGGRSKTALTYEDIQRVVLFLGNFVEVHSIVLPGRIPGYSRNDIKVFTNFVYIFLS